VGGAAARARLDGDGLGLLRCGQDLEWAGLHGLAMRVYADATSLLPATASPGRRARAGVLRALRVYDGRYPHWLPALHEVPTPRQMEVAWKVVSGASVTSVADELFLSGRTVENHLQRVYRALRVHGREELTELLSAPAPPPGWRPGNA
jgi:DNA-binding CsgD family transcriptional regulator